jgi:excisionase family DNA binding protein
MTRDELLALPTLIDVTTAATVLGVGRSLAYELVRTGRWPTPVLRMGRLVKIPTAPLLRLLEQPDAAIDPQPTAN